MHYRKEKLKGGKSTTKSRIPRSLDIKHLQNADVKGSTLDITDHSGDATAVAKRGG